MNNHSYLLGYVTSANIDAEGNIMLLVEGENISGKYICDGYITLMQQEDIINVEVGSIKFLKSINEDIFIHGKIVGNNRIVSIVNGCKIYI